MMSQAIADLREGSLTDSSQSIYQSATEGGTERFIDVTAAAAYARAVVALSRR